MELKTTSDGSHTIFDSSINETYHSIHGAIQEAKHIFIEAGLKHKQQLSEINILEVGFGTGLNTILTLIEGQKAPLIYTTIEKFPLNISIIKKLNYSTQLNLTATQEKLFLKLHTCTFKNIHQITPTFKFLKIDNALENYQPATKFDIVYFDAFSPEKQPELWQQCIFEKIYASMNRNGILVTYCAKGIVKRALIASGFSVEKLPGPPGKREIIRAIKK
ncbi:MAG: SAM-dependent methyltransferase [Flavobacteriales bacterium CG18_big_fil_WC_8_21_14_2_50_32_9]|nr:tRNA (5-methylaminomethyl-2-thiouridine)(34)-methyltransferase MnmD [Flavobacteriales bacterium]PIQ14335.1 MAG: SAM-dependent methyltransferase [Flavobacteriales bacterium CG18_big_fil_WC_8_21_14_2_50_32_9]PJC61777.1 MAG: SAM-dependent methyltransferase [Flavobacteriales bacterium CG_4_9_14_0_2_um_filter_32_27]